MRPRRTAKQVKASLRHAAFTRAPVWLTRGRLARVRPNHCLTITRRGLHLPDLPDELDGLKVTHLSDLHIGALTTPEHLPGIIESAKRCEGDIVAVTGDFVDLSLSVLDDVIASLTQLSAPLGVYMVPGNHDYLDDGQKLIRSFRDAGLKMLMNEHVHLEHNGKKIAVAGIDYAHKPTTLARMVHRTCRRAKTDKHDLSLLLAHHPDAFDPASRDGVDLTLSGHTHGGQFVLSNKLGKKGSIGLGSLAFRYPRGLYRRGDSYLYVNSGVGSWFPLRVRCPAEVACLTLRSHPITSAEQSHP